MRDPDFAPAPAPVERARPPQAAREDLPPPRPRGPSGPTRPPGSTPATGADQDAVSLARAQLGKPYQWGAQGPDRFDCSGLVCHVYGKLGVSMPRVSREQARTGREVARNALRPGDLVFFATDGQGINHVGIYIGHSEFIHAPRRHVPVKTDSLNNAYWSRRYRTARRVS